MSEFLQPYEPSPDELMDRALRDPFLQSDRAHRIMDGFGRMGALVEKPPYFQAPPHPLPPAPPRSLPATVSESGVRGPNDTEVVDVHTYTCGMLRLASLDASNNVEDRAQMHTAGWLLSQGEREAAYPLLAEVKDPELRRMMLTSMSALVSGHDTLQKGIVRITADSELGQSWLSNAYGRAAAAEGYVDTFIYAHDIAEDFDALSEVDKRKIEGLITTALGVDDKEVTDLLVEYMDFMQQKNAHKTYSTRARKSVASLKGMLAQYWADPEDVSQTVRICNTMSTEEDARSLVTHLFEPLLVGFGEMPTDKIIEIWSQIKDFNVLSQVTTETNWMIRRIDIFKLHKYAEQLEVTDDFTQKQKYQLLLAVRLRSMTRGGPTSL